MKGSSSHISMPRMDSASRPEFRCNRALSPRSRSNDYIWVPRPYRSHYWQTEDDRPRIQGGGIHRPPTSERRTSGATWRTWAIRLGCTETNQKCHLAREIVRSRMLPYISWTPMKGVSPFSLRSLCICHIPPLRKSKSSQLIIHLKTLLCPKVTSRMTCRGNPIFYRHIAKMRITV